MEGISNILKKIQSASAPEVEIQKYEIGSPGDHELNQTVLAVTGEDIVAFLGEFFLVEQSNAGIVVDDKNSFHIYCFLSTGLLPLGVLDGRRFYGHEKSDSPR